METPKRKAIDEFLQIADEGEGSRVSRYPMFRRNAWEYFDDGISGVIQEYLGSLTPEKENIVYLDVCGRAVFPSEEGYQAVTQQYSFSRDWPRSELSVEVGQFVGNIFNDGDFSVLIRIFKDEDIKINLVTFNPAGGLARFRGSDMRKYAGLDEKYVYNFFIRLLLKRLKELRSVMKNGGLLFLGESFYHQINSTLIQSFTRNPRLLLRSGYVIVPTKQTRDQILLKAI